MIGRGPLVRLGLGAVLLTAGCSLADSDPMVDGWAVGELRLTCTNRLGDETCGPYLGPALEALGGAPEGTTEVTVHAEGVYPGGVIPTRAGLLEISIVVVTNEDGSRRAVGVGCGSPDAEPPTDCIVLTPLGAAS